MVLQARDWTERELSQRRDEWDGLIAWLRRERGPFPKMHALRDELADAAISGPDWLQRQLAPDAGLMAQGKADFFPQLELLKAWIETQRAAARVGFEAESEAAFRAGFFTRAVQLQDRGYPFVGREDELARIHDYFRNGHKIVSLTAERERRNRRRAALRTGASNSEAQHVRRGVAALKGVGGQGKTAIAHQYAKRHAGDYAGIIWIDAEALEFEREILEFLKGHPSLSIDPPNGLPPARYASYFQQIASALRGRILIILDNIPYAPSKEELRRTPHHVDAVVSGFLAAVPKALEARYDILITSRRALLRKKVVNMPIDRLDANEAAQLFIARSGRSDLQTNDQALLALVDGLLGGHALSVALVASLAREESLSLQELHARVQGQIADAAGLGDLELGDDYPHSLYAAFLASFKALSPDARYLFLMLSLFRRDELTIAPIRHAVESMPQREDSPAIAAIRGEFVRPSGSYPALNKLIAYGLVERLDETWLDTLPSDARRLIEDKEIGGQGDDGRTISQEDGSGHRRPPQIRLHEVLYDFSQAQWSRAIALPDAAADLHALEVALTCGACAFAAKRIEAEEIAFLDIETLVGLLLPIVHEKRGIIPSPERIDAALSFWFEYFKFQNFVYDTGLQELLIDQLEALERHIEAGASDDERYRLLLKKLIGHAYYADPLGEGGGYAETCFNEAIALATRIEHDPRYADQHLEIQWYKVFLLNHRSNLASKRRPYDEQYDEVWSDPVLAADLRAIETTLPSSLRSLAGPPELEECELLVRSGIYWGHRGNQDNYILYRRIERRSLEPRWDKLVEDARHHYVMAANQRLLALKIFRPQDYDDHVAKHVRSGDVIDVVPWMDSVYSADSRNFEAYTSFSQAVGDTGHQYRHYHFVNILGSLAADRANERIRLAEGASKALASAKLLWDLSEKTLAPGEVVLKYRLWMASSYAMEHISRAIEARAALPAYDDIVEVMREHIARLQIGAKSSYAFSIDQQKRQLEGVYQYAEHRWPILTA